MAKTVGKRNMFWWPTEGTVAKIELTKANTHQRHSCDALGERVMSARGTCFSLVMKAEISSML